MQSGAMGLETNREAMTRARESPLVYFCNEALMLEHKICGLPKHPTRMTFWPLEAYFTTGAQGDFCEEEEFRILFF